MRKFNTSFSGYDKAEVNGFVSEVTNQYEKMLSNLKERDNEIQRLKNELVRYQNMESTLNRAILVAEDASNQIKRVARDESKTVIDEAKRNASRIINDALIKAERIEMEADSLKRKVATFKRRLKQAIEEQLELVDNLDDIEMN